MKSFKIPLVWQIVAGILLGIAYGLLLPGHIQYVSWMGDIFMSLLKMVVVPIVFTSIFLGVTGIGGTHNLGKITAKTLVYYFATTLIAVVICLFLVNLIKPGAGLGLVSGSVVPENFEAGSHSIKDQLIGIVPSNIFTAMAKDNLVSVIFFTVVFAIFSAGLPEKHYNLLVDFFEAVYDVIMRITVFILKFAPAGVFAIVANMIGTQAQDMDKLSSMAGSLGMLILTVWAGCLIQAFIILPLSVKLLAGENPWRHMRKMSVPLITAFTTCSSSATLPLSIRDTQEKCGVSSKIAKFTLPLGATINMNGTALFECVAAVFIANAYGIELTVGQEITIVVTSLLAGIGCAGIPMAGLVMIAVVLNAAGLPFEGIGMVMAVNQFCEMPRTCLNCYGDMCGAVVIAKSEGESLTI